MLKDMLGDPSDNDEELGTIADDAKMVAERAAGSVDEAMKPIEAGKERNAAMESEAMKSPSIEFQAMCT